MRLNKLNDKEKSLLESLLNDIEHIRYKEEIKNNLRRRIREEVKMETNS